MVFFTKLCDEVPPVGPKPEGKFLLDDDEVAKDRLVVLVREGSLVRVIDKEDYDAQVMDQAGPTASSANDVSVKVGGGDEGDHVAAQEALASLDIGAQPEVGKGDAAEGSNEKLTDDETDDIVCSPNIDDLIIVDNMLSAVESGQEPVIPEKNYRATILGLSTMPISVAPPKTIAPTLEESAAKIVFKKPIPGGGGVPTFDARSHILGWDAIEKAKHTSIIKPGDKLRDLFGPAGRR